MSRKEVSGSAGPTLPQHTGDQAGRLPVRPERSAGAGRAPASQDAARPVRAAKYLRGGGNCRRAGRNLGDHLLPGRNAPSSRPAAGTVPAAAVIRVRDGAGRPSGDSGGAGVMAARLAAGRTPLCMM